MFSERETYLQACSTILQHSVFTAAGIEPAQWEAKKYRVSCGFPLGFRGSRSGKYAIGQAFDPSISADDTCEIFINPILAEPAQVVAVLIHELIHVFAGVQEGHKGEFARIARAVGLEGKLTATVAGAELQTKIDAIVAQLGAYPHAPIDPQSRKKQGTRLLKLNCAACDWTARVSAMQSNRLNAESACPCCGESGTLNVDGND